VDALGGAVEDVRERGMREEERGVVVHGERSLPNGNTRSLLKMKVRG